MNNSILVVWLYVWGDLWYNTSITICKIVIILKVIIKHTIIKFGIYGVYYKAIFFEWLW